jgi:hypothetical protein
MSALPPKADIDRTEKSASPSRILVRANAAAGTLFDYRIAQIQHLDFRNEIQNAKLRDTQPTAVGTYPLGSGS